ncbi:transporter substrate-binding domain-containing protein [Saccharopolyspora hordei]|uniref:Glutamate transport system substrate-binding protein n=1 Tax=Saccharopolyspora hordei TaxID=1838 RepID=A0A853AI05_9PSEU|nr:transporter substrate-binding domain-containing protein [Saccharopolyspora hordei]NYI82729.1 glutamate transport system substrate-binding protein [Saccharopolyspora hordei]
MKARTVALASVLLLLAGCSDRSDLFPDAEFINVATKVDQPGLASFRGGDTSIPQGFEVNIANELSREFDRKVRFLPITSAIREAQLRSGQANVVVASYSMTKTRKDEFDMVGPYLLSNTGVMVRSDSTITSRKQISASDVCTASSTTTAELIEADMGGEPQTEPGFEKCTERLAAADEVQAVITDRIILEGLAAEADGKYRILDDKFGSDGKYAIAMKKRHPEECERIEEWLKDYVQSPQWTEDFRTYFPDVEDIDEYRPNPAQVEADSQCTE